MKSIVLKSRLWYLVCLFFLTFSVSAFAVSMPQLNTPSYDGGTSVTFSWSSPGSTNNRIVISQDSSFSGYNDTDKTCSNCATTATGTTTSHTKTNAYPGNTYYFKVRSNYGSNGSSDWAYGSFTVPTLQQCPDNQGQKYNLDECPKKSLCTDNKTYVYPGQSCPQLQQCPDNQGQKYNLDECPKKSPEPTPITCTLPQVLNADQTACIAPALTCTLSQVKNVEGTACVDSVIPEPKPITCTLPQVLNAEKTACVDETPEPIICDDGTEVASKDECATPHSLSQPIDSTLDDQMEGSVLGQCVYGGYCISTVMTKVHNGVDIMLDVGTPVYAVCDGTVKSVAKKTVAIANRFTIIDHSGCGGYDKLFAYYGYIDPDLSIKSGSKVEAGQPIGTVAKQSSSRLGLSFNSDFVPKELGYTVVKQKTTKDCKEASVLKRREQLDAKGWLDPIIEGSKSGWNPVLLSGGSVKTGCDATEQQYNPVPNGTTLPYAPWERIE